MKASSLVLLNTIASYGRTCFVLALGLFSGRWIYNALGEVDYGLFGTIGAFIVFVSFFNNVTSAAASRFFAIHIGKKDQVGTRTWFNTAFFVHLILGAILAAAGYFTGIWAFQHFFNIPAERLLACEIVFGCSLAGLFVSMISAPFLGMFTAKQRIVEMSFWTVFSAILYFGFTFFLTIYHGDRLQLYAIGMTLISSLTLLVQDARAIAIFPECRFVPAEFYNRLRIRKLVSFVSWSLWGNLAGLLNRQGIIVLMNHRFAPQTFPSVNASFSLGHKVCGYTQILTSAIHTAFLPEITSAEGRGERNRVSQYALASSKFSILSTIFFAAPFVFEADNILSIWLGAPPAEASLFLKLLLLTQFIDRFTMGQSLAIQATGKLARFQLTTTPVLLMAFPLTWILYRLGYPPEAFALSLTIPLVAAQFLKVYWGEVLADISGRDWVRTVLFPCFGCAIVVLLAAYAIRSAIGESLSRIPKVFLVALTTTLSLAVSSWLIVFNDKEKRIVSSLLHIQRHKPQ